MRTVLAPTTGLGERQRQTESNLNNFPGHHEGIRQTYGIVTSVHPEFRFVKAADEQGQSLAGDKWIPVMHTAKDISDTFGKLKTGMFALVTFAGSDGGWANAFIIGEPGEKHAEVNRPNSFSLSSWRIFQ